MPGVVRLNCNAQQLFINIFTGRFVYKQWLLDIKLNTRTILYCQVVG